MKTTDFHQNLFFARKDNIQNSLNIRCILKQMATIEAKEKRFLTFHPYLI